MPPPKKRANLVIFDAYGAVNPWKNDRILIKNEPLPKVVFDHFGFLLFTCLQLTGRSKWSKSFFRESFLIKILSFFTFLLLTESQKWPKLLFFWGGGIFNQNSLVVTFSLLTEHTNWPKKFVEGDIFHLDPKLPKKYVFAFGGRSFWKLLSFASPWLITFHVNTVKHTSEGVLIRYIICLSGGRTIW